MPHDPTTKHCPQCDQGIADSGIRSIPARSPGVYCILCQRAYNRDYYAKNKERLDAVNRAYAMQHKDAAIAYRRQYQDEHPDLYENRKPYYQSRYREKGEAIRVQQREYQRTHHALSARRTMRYYARKLGAAGTHTAAEWAALREWFGGCCLSCGTTKRLEADHVIPLTRGGADTIANIQPLCRSCNAAKATQSTDYRDPDWLAALLEII